MIDSNRVKKSGGLMIYHLHDDFSDDEKLEIPNKPLQTSDNPLNVLSHPLPQYKLSTNTMEVSNEITENANIPDTQPNLEEIFGHMADEKPRTTAKKKLTVIVDGANVGWCYGIDHFDVTGIELALEYFSNKLNDDDRDFSIVTFIPSHYLQRKPPPGMKKYNVLMETEELDKLFSMLNKGLITMVPSGDNDDLYIIAYARENNGFIISNDLYADHIRGIENISIRRAMKAWIDENRCGYTFVGHHSMNKELMLNPDSALYQSLQLNTSSIMQLGQSIFQNIIEENLVTQLSVKVDLQSCLPDVHALSIAITVLASRQQIAELKHAILARAYSLQRHRFYTDCLRDVEFILAQIDNQCVEAWNLWQSVRKELQPFVY